MKRAFVLLATGFEELEAIGTIDILRRGGVETITVSVTGDRTVTGVHNIPVIADELLDDINYFEFDALILPGGGPGSIMLRDHTYVREVVTDIFTSFKLIAAICAAPRVLGSLGLLTSRRKVTCYPGIEPEMNDVNIVSDPVVTDGEIITARGPAFVIDFGLAILKYLGADAKQVASDMLVEY